MNKDIIKLNNIVKFYDNKTRALDGLDIVIRQGDWTSIMGHLDLEKQPY